jgi:hypothetical protein
MLEMSDGCQSVVPETEQIPEEFASCSLGVAGVSCRELGRIHEAELDGSAGWL